MPEAEKPKSIGALWLKEKDGKQWFSGVLENVDGTKVNIVVFSNDYKKEEKHPDYRIFRSTKQGDSSPAPAKAVSTGSDEVPPLTDADAPADVQIP